MPMLATVKLGNPKNIEIAKLKLDQKVLGKTFKHDSRAVSGALEALAENWEVFAKVASVLIIEGKTVLDSFKITKDMVTWKTSKKVHEIQFTPSIIEPSFGMDQVLYSLLKQSFYQQESDEQQCDEVSSDKEVNTMVSHNNTNKAE
eukprot:10437474-Ditylum_brightwellii.AAC.1